MRMADSSSSESDCSSFSSYSSDSSSSTSSTTSADLSSDSSASSTSSDSTSTSLTSCDHSSSDSSTSLNSSDSTSTSSTTSNDSSFSSIASSLQGINLHGHGFFVQPFELWNIADEVLSLAKPGDLIEFKRYEGIYCHWAVYVGNGYVINYGRPHPSPNLVQKEFLTTVSAGDPCRINNLKEEARKRRLKPFKSKKIVERAAAQLGKEFPYNLITNNCEVFATKCRYGGEGFTCQPLKKVKDAIGFPSPSPFSIEYYLKDIIKWQY